MLHELELKATLGARKARKRVGRGPGSGHGKTSGKGSKGQLARTGGGTRPGFEGGQLPFFQRLPKRGFNNINRVEYSVVGLSDLNVFNDGDIITPELLLEKKIIKKLKSGVKVLLNGSLEKKITIKAHKFSKTAYEEIQKAGGKAEVI